MSFIIKTARQSAIQSWIAANAPGSLRPSGTESWRAYLSANGGTGQSLRDLEFSFLAAQGASGGTLQDRWANYLNAQSGAKATEKARALYK